MEFGLHVAGNDAVGLVIEPDQICKLAGATFERRHQRAVFDVVSEFIETDFPGRKPDFRRTDKAAGVVDQPHHLERRRLVFAAVPDLELPKEIDGAAKQRRRPVIAIRRAARDQSGFRPGVRECYRRREAGRTAADHGDVVSIVFRRYSVHRQTIDVCADIFNPYSTTNCSRPFARRKAASSDVQSRMIPDSTAGKWTNQANELLYRYPAQRAPRRSPCISSRRWGRGLP